MLCESPKVYWPLIVFACLAAPTGAVIWAYIIYVELTR